MKTILLLLTILTLAPLAAPAKPASTHWETHPKPPKHGVAYVCPHCGQVWGNIPPNLKDWERRHLLEEMGKFIALHMRVRHGEAGAVRKQIKAGAAPRRKRTQKKG